MRLLLFRTCLVAAVLLAAACKDFLTEEPRAFTTTDTFFRTGADLNSATIAIYQSYRQGVLAGFVGLHGNGPWTSLELASDQIRSENREPNFNTKSSDYLEWSPTTGTTGGYWNIMYSAITRANLAIDRAPGIATTNEAMRDFNVGEARFLRAYAYFWLTKVYDAVPLLLTPEEQANPRPTRTPVDEIHLAIIADLTAAEAALPETWPSVDGFGIPTQGRVTKGAAQMALADLYLWRSSFLNSGEWQQAADAAERVITGSTWGLEPDYLQTFRTGNEGNQEMIFFLTNTGLDQRTSNVFQLFYYPRDWGLDLGQGGGWGLIHPTDWFYNSYLPGDYRRSTGKDYTSDSAYVSGGCSISNICVDPLADGPMPWKYRQSGGGASWFLGDTDVPLYRFAEALLIAAEAHNELGNTGTAVGYLNMIRARARGGVGGAESRAEPHDYGAAGEPTDQVSLRDAIYMERAWELAFEAKRWFDLVRRDTIDPGYWATSLSMHDPNSENQRPVLGQEHRKRFPIPQVQIDANPALTQNPGY
jgi:hypothetical protein